MSSSPGKEENKGLRLTSKYKSIVLSLYHSSPKTYKLLHKLFKLTSVKTLYRDLKEISVQSGFNEQILEALGCKASSVPEVHTLCAILVDEMSIKESVSYNARADDGKILEDLEPTLGRTKYVANHAAVFIVRGFVTKWKQPLG